MVRQATPSGQRTKRGSNSARQLLGAPGPGPRATRLAALVACGVAYDCHAIDRVALEIGQLSTAGVQASKATITLDVSPGPDPTSTLRTQIGQLHIGVPGSIYAAIGRDYTEITVTC